MRILATSDVREMGDGKTELQIAALTLLARTLSNLKAVMLLLHEKQIVEARAIVRCCYENSLWAHGLLKGGQKFKNEMMGHEMKHKRITIQTVLSSRAELEEDNEEKLKQWMRDTKDWEASGTITPKGVAKMTADESYLFYQYLSLDAHPTVHTLSRYFDETDGDAGAIVVEPEVQLSEETETLFLVCLPVLGVLLHSSQLLGHKETPQELLRISQEYMRLSKLSL
jgi:hypothetical protein